MYIYLKRFISSYLCKQKLKHNVTDCILDTNKYSVQLIAWRMIVFELIHEGYKSPSVEFEIQSCSQNCLNFNFTWVDLVLLC